MPDNKQDLQIGHAVYYPFEKAVGLIYRTYTFVNSGKRLGVSVLLIDGRDVGDFSPSEADQHLMPLGDTGLRYYHESGSQLADDCQRGYFSEAFHNAEVLFIAYQLANPSTQK